MNKIEELQLSLNDFVDKVKKTDSKTIAEKYGVVINGIQNTISQIIKSGSIVADDQYNAIDEQIKQQKIKFLEEDAIKSRNKMILVTAGIIGIFFTLYWLSSKKN